MIRNDKKNILAFLLFSFFILFSGYGCAEQYTRVEELDTNQDGKKDVKYYFIGEVKRKEYIDYLDGIYKAETFEWDKNGNLIKTITEYKNDKEVPFIAYYIPGKKVVLNGKEYNKQVLNKRKTFKEIATEEWLGESKSASYVFTRDSKLRFSGIDNNGDGIMESISIYDDYGRLAKLFEDKDNNGTFDIFKEFSFGRAKNSKSINIPSNTSFYSLRKYPTQ